ncbi:hypothetical protein V496_02400 [Pseudogymnoascus sp. VKM F-4515 (FW-2607)]|nr:hypothetical protein V496_02400 [Pseudogymnoascus sp. VKM F-4515 (FW-2607)]
MASSTAQPASNMVLKYEVKLLIDPTIVLDSSNKLMPTVLDSFTVATTAIKMNVQFLDTNFKDIYNSGWSPRIRKLQGEADFKLTYKRRYKIDNGDIDAALTIADKDGFDLANTTYKAQVPSEKNSRDMLIEKAPIEFNDSNGTNWGTDELNKSRIYRPVLAERYTGT